jgi:hypothetical protein
MGTGLRRRRRAGRLIPLILYAATGPLAAWFDADVSGRPDKSGAWGRNLGVIVYSNWPVRSSTYLLPGPLRFGRQIHFEEEWWSSHGRTLAFRSSAFCRPGGRGARTRPLCYPTLTRMVV